MKVSYLVAIGVVLLFCLLFVFDYVYTSAPEITKPDSQQTPVSISHDTLAPLHKGRMIKNGNSTRDIFEALAADDTTNIENKKPPLTNRK